MKAQKAEQEQAEQAQVQRDEAAGLDEQPADGEGTDASIAANARQGVVAAEDVEPVEGDDRTPTQVNQQEGNRAEHAPKEQSDESKFAVQNPDFNLAGIGSKPVEVDLPDQHESWLAMGTVPDVMDPMIEGDAREQRSKTVLAEGVLPEAKEDVQTPPIEATQGFDLERAQKADRDRAVKADGRGGLKSSSERRAEAEAEAAEK